MIASRHEPGWIAEPARWIGQRERPDHALLRPEQLCLYLGELQPAPAAGSTGINTVIAHFKRSPLAIARSRDPERARADKERAIAGVAMRLRRAFGAAAVGSYLTFVPIPPSKRSGDPAHCDRLARALRLAFGELDADIRPLLVQRVSTYADHERRRRLTHERLFCITELDPAQLARPLRPIVALVDDVLTSGKHLRVASERIRERFPAQDIIAVVLARRARSSRRPC